MAVVVAVEVTELVKVVEGVLVAVVVAVDVPVVEAVVVTVDGKLHCSSATSRAVVTCPS